MKRKVFLLIGTMSCVIGCLIGVGQAQELKINSGTFIMLSQPDDIDDNLWKSGKIKAKEMGLNPICLFSDKSGSISFGKGMSITLKNDKYVFADKDMLINAGENTANVNGIVLNKGEYAIVENGVIRKQEGVLTNVLGSQKIYSVFIATNQGAQLLSKVEKVLHDSGYPLVDSTTELNKDSQGLIIHYVDAAKTRAQEIAKLLEAEFGMAPEVKKSNLISDDDIVIWLGK